MATLIDFGFVILSQANPGVVTCMDGRSHGLQTGQTLVFREINGMHALNNTHQKVTGIQTHWKHVVFVVKVFHHYIHFMLGCTVGNVFFFHK